MYGFVVALFIFIVANLIIMPIFICTVAIKKSRNEEEKKKRLE